MIYHEASGWKYMWMSANCDIWWWMQHNGDKFQQLTTYVFKRPLISVICSKYDFRDNRRWCIWPPPHPVGGCATKVRMYLMYTYVYQSLYLFFCISMWNVVPKSTLSKCILMLLIMVIWFIAGWYWPPVYCNWCEKSLFIRLVLVCFLRDVSFF